MLQELLSNKRLLAYLGINIVVSALTTLLVIAAWMRLTVSSSPTELIQTSAPSNQYAGVLQINSVIGAGDLANEHVVIDLLADDENSLSEWLLRDENGNEYRFPALVLHPGAQVTVWTSEGDDTASELYWGRQSAAWNSGEQASLVDPSGQVQTTYTVP
ncbi:MAG TPA: lamin tail domain-containing protein [Terriglobales bacterium]|nr:lamin tail domain-containing protein [Terriglobales bacterium]